MDYIKLNLKTYDLTAKEFVKKIPLRKKVDEKIIKRFISHIENKPDCTKVLDIGPGNGQMARLLCDHGYQVVGIEFSKSMARIAQKTAPKMEMIVDNFLDYDFGKEKFSGILAAAFVHLFPKTDCAKVLRKIYELLLDRGCAFISTNKKDKSEEGLFQRENFQNKALIFRKRFTKEELANMLLDAGFEILEYEEDKDTEVNGKTWMNFIVQKKL